MSADVDNAASVGDGADSSTSTTSTKIPKSILKDTSGSSGGSGIRNNHKVNLAAGASADRPKKMYRTNTIKLKKEGESEEDGSKTEATTTASKGFSAKHKIDQTKRHSIGTVKSEDVITNDMINNPESPRPDNLAIDMEFRNRSNSMPALQRNQSKDKMKREVLTERTKKDKCNVC